MTANRATRRGNGAGHGGPANGPGYGGAAKPAQPFTHDNQPSPAAKSAGHEVAAAIRARIIEHKEAILDAQLERAKDKSHPQGHQAAVDLLNRVMPPETKVSVARTMDPDQLTDAELAAIAAGGRRAPAGAEGGTGEPDGVVH